MFFLLYRCISHLELSILIGCYLYLMLLTLYQGSLLSLIIPLDLFFFQRLIVQSSSVVSLPTKIEKKDSPKENISNSSIVKDLIPDIEVSKEPNPYSQCSPQLKDVLAFTSDNLGLNYLNNKDDINYNGSSQNK